MAVRMELARILIRETHDSHVVELREMDGQRIFPIVIGLYEASAIERRLLGHQPPRPQTHELLESVIERLGAQVASVTISDLESHTFYAVLGLERDGERIEIDARPSDALALSAAKELPVYVAEHVLEQVCPPE